MLKNADRSNFEAAIAEAQKQVDEKIIQGAVVASNLFNDIIVVGNQTVNPNILPMTEKSRFDIASVGKIMTTAAVYELYRQGELELDAPFSRYLPEHVLGDKCNITIRDLAMHCSGFDNSKPYSGPDFQEFEDKLFSKKPVWARLERFEYSCSNFILLGKIVNRISGLDLDAFAKKYIWEPLGMQDTTWNPPGEGPNEVEHWGPNRPAGQHNDTECFLSTVPLGSGSCFSTIHDMMIFANDILEEKTFDKEYYDLIKTCGFDKDGTRRSFGWDMTNSKRPQKLSPATIFHSGFTGQTIYIDPQNNFCAVVLTSRTGDWQVAFDRRAKIVDCLIG